MAAMLRLNVGCGQTPTTGWKNYDNSWSVRLANKPIIALVLSKVGILKKWQRDFIGLAKRTGIQWADVTRKIPELDQSVEILYSSHMIEHLDKDQVSGFLKEARRVLAPGGIIRLAVPNIRFHIDNYVQDNDADRFIEKTLLTRPRPKTFFDKLSYLLVGDRHHKWMYDGESLCNKLSAAGFREPRVMEAGTTLIQDPGQLNLREREPESVFVEAIN
jgi:predicted SAM-dependent methyltransferase